MQCTNGCCDNKYCGSWARSDALVSYNPLSVVVSWLVLGLCISIVTGVNLGVCSSTATPINWPSTVEVDARMKERALCVGDSGAFGLN